MGGNRHRALVLGCHGGVGRALLAVLHNTEPGRQLRNALGGLFLADREPPDREAPFLETGVLLPPTTIEHSDDLRRLVSQHEVTQLIDVSSIDTVDCTQACDELGVDFLCTSVEEWPGRGSIPTDEAIARLLPPVVPSLARRSHLVGSGANPGIVNALVFMGLAEFANRVGVQASVDALELSEVLITEEDTTVEQNAAVSTDVFAMTWSPLHCLEELFEPAAFCARGGRVVSLGHQPTAAWYRARCGDRTIEGMAVPHEEVATLARHFSDVEMGFLYRIPPAARRSLMTHANKTIPEAWMTRRLCPPWTRALTGRDRVGVLLCSRRFGELWVGFDTDVSKGLALGTNATQLQVAAGILAGWMQLGRIKGIHFVEHLNWREYLRVVRELLGPPVIVHDPSAPARSLARRHVGRSAEADART
jgi:homospermidine synthase